MASAEMIKKVVSGYYESTRTGNKEAFVNSFSKDCVVHDPVGAPPMEGHEALGKFFDGIVSLFTQMGLTEDSMFISGNGAAVKWTGRGIAQNGKSITFEGIDVWTVNEEGTIQKAECYWDPGAMMAQIQG